MGGAGMAAVSGGRGRFSSLRSVALWMHAEGEEREALEEGVPALVH